MIDVFSMKLLQIWLFFIFELEKSSAGPGSADQNASPLVES